MSERTGRATNLVKLAAAGLLSALAIGACDSGGTGAAGTAEAASPKADPVGSGGTPGAPPAPDFALEPVVEGSPIRLSDYDGKVLLIDFWATWCGPCRAAIPHLNELYDAYRGQGLEILGISVDQGRGGRSGADLVRAFTERFEMRYPLAMANFQVVRDYGGIRSVPTAFLVDRSGRVRQMYVGLRPKSVYEKEIKALLAESPDPETL